MNNETKPAEMEAALLELLAATEEEATALNGLTSRVYADNTPEARAAWHRSSVRSRAINARLLVLAKAIRDRAPSVFVPVQAEASPLAQVAGKWPGDETDTQLAEIAAR
jgi:hypothetical protein